MKPRTMTLFLCVTCGAAISAGPIKGLWATARVSLTSSGQQLRFGAGVAVISGNGRVIAFNSYSNDLVDNDNNGVIDTFVRDLTTGKVERVSVSNDGQEGNDESWQRVAISADGQFVAFDSLASNLVRHDRNGFADVFLRNRSKGETIRVSVSMIGGNGGGQFPYINADGRYVMFTGLDDLVDGDTNRHSDAYVFDRITETTVRVSVDSQGNQRLQVESYACGISADGRYAIFYTRGAFVPEDTNGVEDIYRHDLLTGETVRVTVGAYGEQGAKACHELADISGDGRFVSFSTPSVYSMDDGNGESDVFVKDMDTGALELVSVMADGQQGDQGSWLSRISADGRCIMFQSYANNFLGEPNTYGIVHLYWKDRSTHELVLVTQSTDGQIANASSSLGTIAEHGRAMVFSTDATNLVSNDTNGFSDVFLRRFGPVPLGEPKEARRR